MTAWAWDRSRSISDRLVALGATTLLLFEWHAGIVARVFDSYGALSLLTGWHLALRLTLASTVVAGLALDHVRRASGLPGATTARGFWMTGSLVAACTVVVGATVITSIIVGVVSLIVFILVQLVKAVLIVLALLVGVWMLGAYLKSSHPGVSFILRAPAEMVAWIAGAIHALVRHRRERTD